MAEVVLTDLVKSYGTTVAVDNISLTMNDGEFITLVGPSGLWENDHAEHDRGLARYHAWHDRHWWACGQ